MHQGPGWAVLETGTERRILEVGAVMRKGSQLEGWAWGCGRGLGTYFHRKVQEYDLHFDDVCFAIDIEKDRRVLKVRRICQIAS